MTSSDPFSLLVPEAQAFLRELSQNNTREWFSAQKKRYEAELKTPATLLLAQIADTLGRRMDRSVTTKLFRPHRDVRFSKDKTPYHLHLHMLWSLPRAGHQAPGLFFGIAPDYVRAGAGVMAFEKPVLMRWRVELDTPFGTEMRKALESAADHGLHLGDAELKRVPAPYSPDHAQADLLRHKGLAVWKDLPKADQATPVTALGQLFGRARGVLDCLDRVL